MVMQWQYIVHNFEWIRYQFTPFNTRDAKNNLDNLNHTFENGKDVTENLPDNTENTNNDAEKAENSTENPEENIINQEGRTDMEGENQENDEDEDDESEDDDVQITIGDIKTGPAAYTGFNLKRGPGMIAQGTGEKSKV